MIAYKFRTKVVALEFKHELLGRYPTGKHDEMGKPVYEAKVSDLGWFVTFEGSHESLGLGFEEPRLKVGQSVNVILEPL